MTHSPDISKYHRSLSDELYAIKDRIRDLVPHFGTDGAHKEAALRTVLRRFLPKTLRVGHGFVVTPSGSSTEIDVLIVDASKPTLFSDGDLMIVTPDAVSAIIEVKTRLEGRSKLVNALTKLQQNENRCVNQKGFEGDIWTGLFVYEADAADLSSLLKAAKDAWTETDTFVNCMAFGRNELIRFWPRGARIDSPVEGSVWHAYEVDNVAPAYFVGDIVVALSGPNANASEFAWAPIASDRLSKYMAPMDDEPRAFR